MAKMSKVTDNRLKEAVRYRVRYVIYFPDGSRKAKERWFKKHAIAKDGTGQATVLEERTRSRRQSVADLEAWEGLGLIDKKERGMLDQSPQGAKVSVKQAFEEYRQSWSVSPEEAVSREGRLRVLQELLGKDTPLSGLHLGLGEEIKLELKRRGLKVVTVRKYLQDLKRALRLQVLRRVIPYNPFAELKAGKRPPEEKRKGISLTAEQVVAVLDKAQERCLAGEEKTPPWKLLAGSLYLCLLLLFGTGMRRKEAQLARFEHINWDERWIRVPAENAKDGESRRIGLGARLFSELLRVKKDSGEILPPFYPTTVTKAVKAHFTLLGLDLRLHDCRHTYITLLQSGAGAAPHEAMQRTGHNDMAMLSRYTHPGFGEVIEDRLPYLAEPAGETKH